MLAIVGPTATGKSALAIAAARAFGGEVVACDSTAVYRGIDIGTDKVPAGEQMGVPHHLVDMVGPNETYSAARYAEDASMAIRDIHARGNLPIVVGGTGFYYRALVRGLFPGPARDEALRARLNAIAERPRGREHLRRWLARVDPASAARIMPGDQKRIVRALEVYVLTGRALTTHFAETTSPLAGWQVTTVALDAPRDVLHARVARRVEEQFARGVVEEVRGLLAAGVPATAHAFSGLVYRQILEMLRGLRGDRDTRALIVQENMRYAKRQRTWFRHEPGVDWLTNGASSDDHVAAIAAALTLSADAGR